MESTISTCAATPEAAPTMSSTQVSASSRAVAASSPRRRARSATCCTDSSPVAYSTGPDGVERRGRLQHERRFADTRIAADQSHRAGHQAAAEHTVEFA